MNNSITVYHKISDGVLRKFYPKAKIRASFGIDTEDHGNKCNNKITVYLFACADVHICAGDKVVLGYSESLTAPKEESFTVTDICFYNSVLPANSYYKLTVR